MERLTSMDVFVSMAGELQTTLYGRLRISAPSARQN
jgi:hypothetical protein